MTRKSALAVISGGAAILALAASASGAYPGLRVPEVAIRGNPVPAGINAPTNDPVITGAEPGDEQGYLKGAWRKISSTNPPEKEITVFIEGLYSKYSKGLPDGFNPLRASAPQVFSSSTVSLLRENQKLTHGELGAIDYDPLCLCQDSSGIRIIIRSINLSGLNDATVVINLQSPDETIPVEFSLTNENDQWRIYDIKTPEMKSIRSVLQADNKNLKSK